VEKWLGGEESFVLEHSDSESDFVHTVSLLGSLDLDQSLGLESSELVLSESDQLRLSERVAYPLTWTSGVDPSADRR
jgi:hypothetical protein